MANSFIIGIDLGTTNSTLAFAEPGKGAVEQFDIPQITNAGLLGKQETLPSFLYFPMEEELAHQIAALEWGSKRSFCVGEYAKGRGAELPQRLIASAKSWLCYEGVDRRKALLPFGAVEGPTMSPVQASAEYLRHLREAWDFQHPQAPFSEQTILVTVPASFDPSARQLVQEAAESAGYPEILLLEEPQAAFYAWLQRQGEEWRRELKVGDVILVVDVGGGTTDFSLIAVKEQQGDLTLERYAVGDHLLLGGDNMDLALAYLAKAKLEEQGHELDDWQFRSLVALCRSAKEELLSENAREAVEIALQGRGSRLIGGSLQTSLARDEVLGCIVDGFAPIVLPQERAKRQKRSGIQQIGLPYAQDPRITAQLAKFLSMTGETESDSMDHFVLPTAILFNGGVMKAHALRQRLLEQLNNWAKQLGRPAIKELPDPDFDCAVSRGAVYYGMARAGKSIRIRSGTSRSYYIGVEEAAPAVPGIPAPLKAICIVPFGMEEGSEAELGGQEFSLLLGEQATFRFFSHSTPQLSNGVEPQVGTAVVGWKALLKELHPIETVLPKDDGEGKVVKISLKSRVTELGVLELWCAAQDGRKWKLEFDIRRVSD